jgi:hypothetical protein
MKATLLTLAALAVGIAAGLGWTQREFSREVIPVDVQPASATGKPAVKIGPKVTIVNGERYDFGSLERNAHGKHEFVILNDGDAPLTLEAGQPSCSVCIKVFNVAKPVLQPGERTTATIEFEVKNGDAEFEQSGPLTTNDPIKKTVRLSIHGHILDTVRPDRYDIHFHDLSPSETATGGMIIYGYRDRDLAVDSHTLVSETAENHLAVSFRPLTADEIAVEPRAKSGVKVTVEVKPGLPQGDFEGTLTMTTNEGSDPVAVKIVGNVASDILIMGPNVNRERMLVGLGAISQKEGKKQTAFLIVKGPHRDETKVEIESVEPTADFSAKLGDPIRDTPKTIRYPIVIEVPPGAAPVTRGDGNHAKIHIKTTHPEIKELTINVRYVVKE